MGRQGNGDQRGAETGEPEDQRPGERDRDQREQLPLPAEQLAQAFTAGLSE
jgi:hypothetical protein